MFTNDSRFALVPASVKSAITTALQANEETFVLREVYEWLGYSQYVRAKEAFENCGFAETLDFTIVSEKRKNGFGVIEVQNICMTADCFKAFAMQARTERGKQVRLYYIECERQLKKVLEQQRAPKALTRAEFLEVAFESYRRELALNRAGMPGLVEMFECVTADNALPPEHKTAKEIAGDRIRPTHLSAFGRYLTSLYVEHYRTEPPKKLEDGRQVNSYPYPLWSAIDNYLNRPQ